MELSPDVKALLLDVSQFIRSLDGVALQKPVRENANAIIEKILSLIPSSDQQPASELATTDEVEDIYEDIQGQEGDQRQTPPSNEPVGSANSAKSDEPIIPLSPVSSLPDIVIQGYLEKRRPDTGGLKKLLSAYQKRYCVISQGRLYYFDNPNVKNQSGAFSLDDYEARPAYKLFPKDMNKQECSFELVRPGQRTYAFLAVSFENMKEWIQAVARVSKVPHPVTIPHPTTLSTGVKSGSIKDNDSIAGSSEPDDKMSDTDSVSSKIPYPKHTFSPLPATPQPEQENYNEVETGDTYDDGSVAKAEDSSSITTGANDIQEELYDDGGMASDTKSVTSCSAVSPSTKLPSRQHKNEPLPPPPSVEEEETYDDASPALPSRPHKSEPLPPPPPIEEEETYDDANPAMPSRPRKNDPLPPPPSLEEETYDDANPESSFKCSTQLEVEETYDDANVQPKPISMRQLPAPPSEDSEELYDDGQVDTSAGKPSLNKASQPPTRRPLPKQPLQQKEKRLIQISERDYGNMFYGKWDCTSFKSHELSFKVGDVLHVIEKKYESSGWLTAVLNGQVGLVPKSYLTPAYAAI